MLPEEGYVLVIQGRLQGVDLDCVRAPLLSQLPKAKLLTTTGT